MFRIIFKEKIQLLENIEIYHSKTIDDVIHLAQLVKDDMTIRKMETSRFL